MFLYVQIFSLLINRVHCREKVHLIEESRSSINLGIIFGCPLWIIGIICYPGILSPT